MSSYWVLSLSICCFVLVCIIFPMLEWRDQVLMIGACVLVTLVYLSLLCYILCVHMCSVCREESDPLLCEPKKPEPYVVIVNANIGLSVGVDPT